MCIVTKIAVVLNEFVAPIPAVSPHISVMEDKMDKKNQNKVLKKPARAEDSFWDCSVCTYRNGSEAFKCLMCDVRKGTSTRKPRINAQLVAQQVAQQFVTTPPLKKTPSKNKNLKRIRPRLTNVDRDSAQHMAVTVSDVTVIITDYKLLSPAHSPPATPDRTSPVSPAEKKTEPGPSSSTEVNGNGTATEESS